MKDEKSFNPEFGKQAVNLLKEDKGFVSFGQFLRPLSC